MLTHSKSLFDSINKTSSFEEKRLMVDITCFRNGFKTEEILDFGFIRTEYDPADALKKLMKSISLNLILKDNRAFRQRQTW